MSSLNIIYYKVSIEHTKSSWMSVSDCITYSLPSAVLVTFFISKQLISYLKSFIHIYKSTGYLYKLITYKGGVV